MDIVTRHQAKRRAGHLGAAVALIALSLLLASRGRAGSATDDLYRAQTIVTGQGEANRLIGFAACLEDVLIKVSGAVQLAGDPRLSAYKASAREDVRAFSYHDQMSGTPTRDEQGTRDRPYDLTVEFEADKIDGLLAALGLKPWLSHRPVLSVFVDMEQGVRRTIVTSDARQSDLQRDALAAAADKRGMRIVLLTTAALEKSGLTAAKLSTTPSATLVSAVAEQGGEVALVGDLVWSDQELGWATEWRLEWQGKSYRWTLHGVTFDEAFRRGIGGAAQLLSGNGEPGVK
jgi:hypothetical protein